MFTSIRGLLHPSSRYQAWPTAYVARMKEGRKKGRQEGKKAGRRKGALLLKSGDPRLAGGEEPQGSPQESKPSGCSYSKLDLKPDSCCINKLDGLASYVDRCPYQKCIVTL